jgi:hypothetical protein
MRCKVFFPRAYMFNRRIGEVLFSRLTVDKDSFKVLTLLRLPSQKMGLQAFLSLVIWQSYFKLLQDELRRIENILEKIIYMVHLTVKFL